MLRALVEHDLARKRIARGVEDLGERRAAAEALSGGEELAQLLVLGLQRGQLLELRGMRQVLLREPRVVGAQRAARHEEFPGALDDAGRRAGDALNRVDDDGGHLAQRIEILQARIGDEEGER